MENIKKSQEPSSMQMEDMEKEYKKLINSDAILKRHYYEYLFTVFIKGDLDAARRRGEDFFAELSRVM